MCPPYFSDKTEKSAIENVLNASKGLTQKFFCIVRLLNLLIHDVKIFFRCFVKRSRQSWSARGIYLSS